MSDGNRDKGNTARLLVRATIIGFGVAALVIIFGLSQKAKYEREADDAYKKYARYSYNPQRDACLILPFINQVDCLSKHVANAREYQRGEQDLVAQRVTAFWTIIMGCAAIAGMMLSVVGVFLVWTTFRATKEGNDIAKDTAKRQLRSYVGYSGCKMTKTDDFYYIEVTLTNFGQTPADIRGWLVQTYYMQMDTYFAGGGNGGGPIILLPNSSATFTVGGMQIPTYMVVGKRIWVNVKVLFSSNDIYQQNTKTSLELHSRQFLAKPTIDDPSQVVFDLRLQSNTIHDENLVNGISLMLQEADEKEARQKQETG